MKTCIRCGMKDRELYLARADDDTAYRCIGCGELKNDCLETVGARIEKGEK